VDPYGTPEFQRLQRQQQEVVYLSDVNPIEKAKEKPEMFMLFMSMW
jgi:hypothetical protein